MNEKTKGTRRERPKISRRHFRLDWNCTHAELLEFFRRLKEMTIEAEYFRGQIGELYLSVKAELRESDLYGVPYFEMETVEDLLFDYRKKLPVLKTLVKKPLPERIWGGAWIDIHRI